MVSQKSLLLFDSWCVYGIESLLWNNPSKSHLGCVLKQQFWLPTISTLQNSFKILRIYSYFSNWYVAYSLLIRLSVPSSSYTRLLVRVSSATQFCQLLRDFGSNQINTAYPFLYFSRIKRITDVFAFITYVSEGLVQSSNGRAYGSHP